MKRGIIVFALVILSLFLICGCGKVDKVESISLKDYTAEQTIEILHGGFSCEGKTLAVKYSSGELKELPLTEDMIPASERLKFYQDGEHTVKLEYEGVSTEIKIKVSRRVFENVYLEDFSVTYDGNEHTVEVEGDVPAGATITYPQGNTFVNAGTYDVNAIISCEGYVSKSLNAKVEIARAKYDMSGVIFKGATVKYDGQLHELKLEGELPEGVGNPVYYIGSEEKAGAKDVGVYTVTARVPVQNANYEVIPTYEATLTIEQATYDVKGFEFGFYDKDGKELTSEKIYNGEPVYIKLKDTTMLPKDANVLYSVTSDNESFKDVSKQLVLTNAGKYTLTASFVSPDNKNYAPIEPFTVEYEIKKADYDMQGISFPSKVVSYDGNACNLAVEGKLFPGIEVKYAYTKDGKEVAAEDVKTVGSYKVVASFTHSNANYNDIADKEATLIIEQAKISLVGLVSQDRVKEYGSPLYDAAKLNELCGDLVTYKVTFQVFNNDNYEACEKPINVGKYKIKFEFSPKDDVNYVIESGATQEYEFSIVEGVSDET